MIEPLKSTQLIVVREQWQPPVSEGGKIPNLHGSWRLVLGLRERKSDSPVHQNYQLIPAAGSPPRQQGTVKGHHLAEECEMR